MPTECIANPLQRELADCIIKLAHLDELRILLACGAKVDESVTQGLKPIHYAVWQGYHEAVQLLLVRGCDVNTTDDCGYSPLHLAAEHGYLEMVLLLLQHGAKTNYRDDVENNVLFPRTTRCDEPLRLAIKNHHYEVAQVLLEHGANPTARYFFGAEINLVNPMDVQFLELLLTYGAEPDARDRGGLTPLMKIARLPQAIESVLCLISHGANVNAMTDDRHDFRTVLHYAVLSGNYDTVSLLIKQGAEVNFKSDYQKPTPLDLAILKGDVPIIQLLLESGADVNASSPIIGSPLHVACADNIPNRLPILKMLLERGADPNKKIFNEDGIPLKPVLGEYLSSNDQVERNVIKLLIMYGSKVILKSQFRDPAGLLNCLSNVGTNPDLMMELIETAEAFDPPMIRRCPSLTLKQKDAALTLARNPKTLKQQTRLYIRNILGKLLPRYIDELILPRVLQNYLLYESS